MMLKTYLCQYNKQFNLTFFLSFCKNSSVIEIRNYSFVSNILGSYEEYLDIYVDTDMWHSKLQ